MSETYAEVFAWLLMSARRYVRRMNRFNRRFPSFDKREWFPRCANVIRSDLLRLRLNQNRILQQRNKRPVVRVEQRWVE